mmetsp:Transcript_84917/g.132721  ORF Transcript_84917/g.132721 Transcript_84917/m.132721 type:complete len:362 (-) Transcript_84917:167-1252(-)
MAFLCQICFEEKSVRLALPRLATGNGDVLRMDDCQHPICQECLSTFVSTRINEQRVFNIRCPFVGCSCEIFEQDLQRLVQGGALTITNSERFAELRSRDFSARAESLSGALIEDLPEKDLESVKRIWQTMRFCPRCHLAIERSHGCNSFYCTCGHHFNFALAPRVVGDGIQNFGKVIEVAKNLGVPLAKAESFVKDNKALGEKWSPWKAIALHRNVSRIAADTGAEFDDAFKLQQQARNGDEAARAKIRAAKYRISRQTYGEEEKEDEELYALAWNSEPTDAEAKITEKDYLDVCTLAREQVIEDKCEVLQDTDETTEVLLFSKDLAINTTLAPAISLCPKVFLEICTSQMAWTEMCDRKD